MENNAEVEFPGVVDTFYPVNGTLSARYKKAFGYVTVRYRLPIILDGIIKSVLEDEAEMVSAHGQEAHNEMLSVVQKLEALKDEMIKNQPIVSTSCPIWNAYLEQVGKNFFNGDVSQDTWIMGPFLHTECYMYHRMSEAFKSSKMYTNYDPFRKQKEGGFFQSLGAMEAMLDWLNATNFKEPANIQSLLEICLWGNRCDLSISQGADNSQKTNIVDQLSELRSKIISDDSQKFWKHISPASKNQNASRSLGLILDNAGFELFTDLCLGSKLIETGIVDSIVFYTKAQPWFVSDVMIRDFNWLVEALISSEGKPALQSAGQLWKEYLSSGKFSLIEHPFWTYPHSFDEMKRADPELYTQLGTHKFCIFKGDLNYRKLMGEINWAYETPFTKALQGFHPAPLLSLRTLKADAVAGLPPGVGEKLSEKDHKWMNTGEYGVIQFSDIVQPLATSV